MAVQAFITINYDAESQAAVQSFIDSLTLPDGAHVNATVNETITSGIVQGGVVQQPEPAPVAPVPLEPPPPEPAP